MLKNRFLILSVVILLLGGVDNTILATSSFSTSTDENVPTQVEAPVSNIPQTFRIKTEDMSNKTRIMSLGNTVYRLYNIRNMEHLYTTDKNELDVLLKLANTDWKYEGPQWMSLRGSSTPVYRVYNPHSGEHIYTKDSYEVKILHEKYGWRKEGIKFYSESQTAGDPIYRLFNSAAGIGAHFVTPSKHEKETLIRRGWKYEGIAWYSQKTALINDYSSSQIPMTSIDYLGYTVYSQQNSHWANMTYGTGYLATVGTAGCGAVSAAMAITALTGKQVTPLNIIPWANANNAITWAEGSNAKAISKIATNWGIRATVLFDDYGVNNSQKYINIINNVLKNGGMVSISGAAYPSYSKYPNGLPSPFTSSGHYIIIKKLTNDGKWMIFDSNSASNPNGMSMNNNVKYNPVDIIKQQHFTAVGLYKK